MYGQKRIGILSSGGIKSESGVAISVASGGGEIKAASKAANSGKIVATAKMQCKHDRQRQRNMALAYST